MEAKRETIKTKLQGEVKEAERETTFFLFHREMDLLRENSRQIKYEVWEGHRMRQGLKQALLY